MSRTPERFDALVKELCDRIVRAGLGPADQVRVLAALVREMGWTLANADLPEDRAALEAHFQVRGDLASALILQGHILREWIDESGTGLVGGHSEPH